MKYSVSLFTAAALLLACACTDKQENNTAATTVQASKPIVRIEKVNSQPVDQLVSFTATAQADIKNNITPNLSVRIKKVLVDVGDHVRAGQVVAYMDDAHATQQKIQLGLLELNFKRFDELYKAGGISKADWDAQKTQLDVAKSAYKNMTENTTLTSPISGIVTARNYDGGDMYAMGNPLLVIEKITPVTFTINVSASYFRMIQKGMKVKIDLDLFPEESFEGIVHLVYPTIDATTRTFPVEIYLQNRDQRVRPGMFGRVEMNFGTKPHVVVPDMAVVKRAGTGDRYVYTYADGTVQYKKVLLGRLMGNNYEILEGLADGDQVVVAGQSKLSDNKAVALEE